MREGPLPLAEAVALVAVIAEALHHAHRKGLVHRDVKPGNILLDTAGRPYLTDFGLALKETDFGRTTGLSGTPAARRNRSGKWSTNSQAGTLGIWDFA
jgi:serine/threonine protein kinase